MTRRIALVHATTTADYEAARALFREYAQQLGVDLCFQQFAAELDALPQMYGPPTGCLILGRDPVARTAIACVAVRRQSPTTCEMKRLFVAESARQQGIGRRIVRAALRAAAGLGYRRIVLDTLEQMTAARRLYASLGFQEIEAYYHNPLPGVRYMALDLTGPR